MKICIIAKNPQTTFIQRLTQVIGKDCYEIFNPWEDDILPDADLYLVRTSGIYGDDQDLKVIRTLPSEKIINPLGMLELCRDKVRQYRFFPEISPRFLDLQTTLMPKLEGKWVAKPHRGQGGWGVKILEAQDVEAWWENQKRLGDTEYLLQEYIEGEEIRVFFIRDQLFSLKRQGEAGVSNFAQGGKAQKVKLTQDQEDMVRMVIFKSQAHYGAIDFIHRERPSFLELNSMPGIEQIEEVLKIDLIGLLLASLPSKVAKKLKF
jgi:glutathione synthase/RimK-type ligase-like ATP-grasp enzyme